MFKHGIINIQKPSRRFYQYFIYYVVLLTIIIFIIGSVIYKYFVSVLQEEVQTSNAATLLKITETMDMRVKEMNNLAVIMSSNYVLSYNSFVDDGFSRWNCVRELTKYKSSNMFIYDMLFYNSSRNKEIIFTTQGTFDLNTLFTDIYGYENWGKQDFLSTISNMNLPVMRTAERVLLSNSGKDNFLTYIFPIPTNSFKPQEVVVFLIKASTLDSIFSDSLKDYNGYAYILDENSRPIFYHASGEFHEDPLNMLNELNSNNTTETANGNLIINKKNYLLSKSVSSYNGWSYITVMNTDQVFYKVNVVKKILNVTILFTFLLGSIISFIFSLKQYTPLKVLANTIKRGASDFNFPEIKGKDEVLFISQSIEYMSDENSRLSLQLKGSINKVRNEALLSLLKSGQTVSKYEIEMLHMLDIRLEEGHNITVLVFMIDSYKNYCKDMDYKEREIFRLDIINILKNEAQKIGKSFCVDLMENGKIAMILSMEPDLEVEKVIVELTSAIKVILAGKYQLSITVGVGRTCNDLRLLKYSFAEALKASEYKLIYGKNQIIFSNKLDNATGNFIRYTANFESNLEAAVKQADHNKAEEVINEIISTIVDADFAPEQVYCTYYGIINGLIKMTNELNIVIDKDSRFDVESFITSDKFEVINDFRDVLKDLCFKICNVIQEQRNKKDENLAKSIVVYIDKNYSDNNLLLENISKAFGISNSHSSKVFKAYTGYTIKQYVDELRLEKVKQLLKNTDYKLQDILESAGYLDKANFIRKFRNKEGITPIQYRTMSKSVKEQV